VPPLRERKEDIPILVAHFLEVACKRFNRPGLQLTESQLRRLQNYEWPGNVRQLENSVERAAIAARANSLRFDIPETAAESPSLWPPGAGDSAVGENATAVSETEMKRRERENIAAALKLYKGLIYGPGGAAELLGV
jgi:DNA-binding NtrC family response regulator